MFVGLYSQAPLIQLPYGIKKFWNPLKLPTFMLKVKLGDASDTLGFVL